MPRKPKPEAQQRAPRGSGEADAQLLVWVPLKMHAQVHNAAKGDGVTASEWVRRVLRGHLERG